MLNLDIMWLDEPRCGLRWLGLERGGLFLFEPRRNSFQRRAFCRTPTSAHLQSYRKLPLQAQVQNCSRSSTNHPQSSACDWLDPAPREALQQAPSRATETSAVWRVLLTTPRSISSQSTSAIAPPAVNHLPSFPYLYSLTQLPSAHAA
jgi:hypothetical protein